MRVGLDIGSTTIKCVVLNDAGQIVYSTYERHFSHILEKGRALLEKVAAEYLPDGRAYLAISGSAGMGLADSELVARAWQENSPLKSACRPSAEC